jgi:hypothetical protein
MHVAINPIVTFGLRARAALVPIGMIMSGPSLALQYETAHGAAENVYAGLTA